MKLDFDKSNGLIPVIIQDELTLQILMLGYMNEEAFEKTKREGKVTFFSRSKNRLWTKGETSHNYLWVKKIDIDCDHDTLLIKVSPEGPTCHTGSYSCFEEQNVKGFVYKLQNIISQRIDEKVNGSYTYQLYQKGINKVAQKVGEEAVEVVIEAKDTDDVLFKNEAADLLYHYLILLKAKGFQLEDIEKVLFDRNH
ncbi:bifunctional phosphoribosyl-AMP cyclohydrolase/phosphoribosyl-ATP diphosphatase HisIE [Apibacter mensalis]|uniref:bifunctional phosphoribosyl-AMP cyclohydrolase/phosphoribosyl-ATP diphosphatase HisIE n=1 Tax=Apibacter mensalis TaxID=1586267 RepID=UPI0026EC53D2|nr:bifunctional phosphoribosyl-AMP cyclohydrolase/phosphoribosyl-ATP diphosphatase HisIE [Apibacter mensalis]